MGCFCRKNPTNYALFWFRLTCRRQNIFQLVDPNYDGEDPINEYTEITSANSFSKGLVPVKFLFAFKLVVKNAGTVFSTFES